MLKGTDYSLEYAHKTYKIEIEGGFKNGLYNRGIFVCDAISGIICSLYSLPIQIALYFWVGFFNRHKHVGT